MVVKKNINEIVYEPGMSFEKAEAFYFNLDSKGPKYQFVFGKNHFSPQDAFSKNDYKIRQVLDGRIIDNEKARENLTKRLFTVLQK